MRTDTGLVLGLVAGRLNSHVAKKLKFESYKYHFLTAARRVVLYENRISEGDSSAAWRRFVAAIEFSYRGKEIEITWDHPFPGKLTKDFGDVQFYTRSDNKRSSSTPSDDGSPGLEDAVKEGNRAYFDEVVRQVAESAGFILSGNMDAKKSGDTRAQREREFHNAWASSEQVATIDVRASSEACTSPEMRFITRRLGDLKGRRLLDVGCGLGEASVYFALKGALVTSTDLSEGMLNATSSLACLNGVSVRRHLASAEDMRLSQNEHFDVIYAGNLLHHVNIDDALSRVKPHLAPHGVFVSWDPLAYNPAINIYRAIAREVRTPDEHPLRLADIRLFRKHFMNVETRFFWFSTLAIFIIMAVIERRNPNKERFWKAVVRESERWAALYKPLEALDNFILRICPPLRLLCWNVVIVASKPRVGP